MNGRLESLVSELLNSLAGYLPKILSGLALLGIGWLLAWFAKRLVVRLAAMLKVEHLMPFPRWQATLRKADVRYGFYNFIGNVCFFSLLLIFFYTALKAWELKYLPEILGTAILFIPRLLAAALVFGLGWLVARWADMALTRLLEAENVPAASTIAAYGRVVLVVFFSAMALVELDIAREVVLIGFIIIMLTLGIIAILTALGKGHALSSATERDQGGTGEAERKNSHSSSPPV